MRCAARVSSQIQRSRTSFPAVSQANLGSNNHGVGFDILLKMSAPQSAPSTSWLPTNQQRDFTFVTSTADTGDTVDSKPISSDKPKSVTKGRTFQDVIAGHSVRVQACYCYESRARSITVRSKTYSFAKHRTISPPDFKVYKLECSGYQPNPEYSSKYLVSVYETCRAVFRALRLSDDPVAHGFLIISGSTNSMKTNLAMGLIQMLLEDLMKHWLKEPNKKRKPHLVTCEDNIEEYFIGLHQLRFLEHCYELCNELPQAARSWLGRLDMPDYTPRLRGTDTEDLGDAVDDALRMTPSVFYAGEIRRSDDWEELRRLAESNLVVVTTHASSLINTFGILRRNLKAHSPAQRSELASALRAVVHMRGEKLILSSASTVEFVLPSCWVRTPAAVAAFTSDGMASIIPKFVNLAGSPEGGDVFCLGRRSFAYAFAGFSTAKAPVRPEPPLRVWKATGERIASGPSGDADPDTRVFSTESELCNPNLRPKLPDEGSQLTELATAWDLRGE